MYLHFGPSIKSQGNTPWKRPTKKKILIVLFQGHGKNIFGDKLKIIHYIKR